jgi:hypothetical protein
MFDLRVPSGLFFTLLGALLVLFGLVKPDLRAALTTVNVNLYSGIPMLIFGVALLVAARRSSSSGG